MLNIWSITAFYIGIVGLGVGIFLWGKPQGNSLFDRLYQIVCIHTPRLLKKGLEKIFGKRAPAALDAIWVYLCYTSNPLVQMFYLAIVIGGYLTFAIYGHPHLPNTYLSGVHKYFGFVIFNACLGSWWTACRTDPGAVTSNNVDELCEVYQWDEQIFTFSTCQTCDLVKPARSKHCALCDVCVSKFDHHCIWINSCVGVGNHRWFLAFLFTHLIICAYGGGLGIIIIYDLVIQKDLMNAVFVDPTTQARIPASIWIIVQYMLATQGMVVFVAIICLVMGVVLAGFFLWHLNLVRIGTTTNELSKWGYVKWCLKQEGEEGKAKMKELRNIYNAGMFANFREVLFPINVHRLPGMLAKEKASSKAATIGNATVDTPEEEKVCAKEAAVDKAPVDEQAVKTKGPRKRAAKNN
eukprot:TRINITY_DN2597_c0_g1_i1.p1 TRINITY_DN2597_c0_g1~~TRINITY_DN2597_c0_g1_i1.p1  ORF type:complete len:409 (+),score=68.24 TRINITY_DN2597_c0_g1_i1:119-1345(+)